MKKIFSFLFLGLSLFIFTAKSNDVSATYLYALENVSITEPLYSDVYILAGNGTIDEKIHGDVYIAGGNVTINADVEEDLVVAGGKVVILGNIGGDLRVLGGQVSVYGNVAEDVVVVSGQLDISVNTVVGENLIVGAGLITIDGIIEGELRGVVGGIFINGSVLRDITLTIEDSIIISEDALIGGNLNYSAFLEARIPEGVVQGSVNFKKFQKERFLNDLNLLLFLQKVVSYASMVILLLVLVFFMPNALAEAAKNTKENLLKAFGMGVLTLVCIFVGTIILMVTIVGIPFALMAFAGMIIIFYFARIFAAIWLASYLFNFKAKFLRLKLFFGGVIALFVYYLLGFIPYHIGRVATFLILIIGIGSLVMAKVDIIKFLRSKKKL
jgi:hypothetical protein